MEEQLITFETAKLAKEKSFNEECLKYFTKSLKVKYYEFMLTNEDIEDFGHRNSSMDIICSAPTQSFLQKWLREKHDIHIAIHPKNLMNNTVKYYSHKGFIKKDWDNLFDTYEEALEQGLLEALKSIE